MTFIYHHEHLVLLNGKTERAENLMVNFLKIALLFLKKSFVKRV